MSGFYEKLFATFVRVIQEMKFNTNIRHLDPMIKISVYSVSLMLFSGCSRTKEKVVEFYYEKNNVVLTEKCLLFEGRLDYLSSRHEFILYDETDNNSWRKSGWLSAGTQITVTSLRRTVHPKIGETFYFVGKVEGDEPQEFVYVSEANSASKARDETPWKWIEIAPSRSDENSAPSCCQ